MRAKQTKTIKMIVDACMTVLLLCLTAYPATGEVLHEWFGIGMTAALIAHHILNRRWYAALFRGRYNAYRILTTLINTLLLLSIALTALCGMAMSAHAVPFLYGMLPVSFARQFHLALSYWSFVLMGVHLGLHLPAMTAAWNKTVKGILAILCTAIAGAGLGLFYRSGISDYMLFRSPFAFFDYEKTAVRVFLENLAMLSAFAAFGACAAALTRALAAKKKEAKKVLLAVVCLAAALLIGLALTLFVVEKPQSAPSLEAPAAPAADAPASPSQAPTAAPAPAADPKSIDDGFVLLPGGTFMMGSPETENWRIDDETQHTVTVSAFYIDPYETTQAEYTRLTGQNPSAFSGDDLPVESISWLDAIRFANAKSLDAGLDPVYTIGETEVLWDRAANGYRLPTEAEWEHACRAGTGTPFNLARSLDADDANFYGHYPYEIEENYFNDSVLEARPGVYRQKTLPVGSFAPSPWGLYDMHGNVNEWCWDYYGAYDAAEAADPAGPAAGTRHVYRGGGWNDFGKNMRSAYRAAGPSDLSGANLGVRLVRNAAGGQGTVAASETVPTKAAQGKALIAFFSWSGNTRGIAKEIQRQTGADILELEPVHPYSDDYNTVLMEAQEDQHTGARPALLNLPETIDEYDVILLGYPNWWASIPMPIATFLEAYDFSGKAIVPFCSHGGGRFGQSLTAIAKLAPNAVLGEGLSIHYSGGSSMKSDVTAWLDANGIQ